MGQGERGDDGEQGDALRIAGDAPVELCVELARFVMPLEELASLRLGQVLFTGRAIGEHVTLRAGDRALARGELVDVEGELGVRISSLAEGEPGRD
jgi:type III secretion protein Q